MFLESIVIMRAILFITILLLSACKKDSFTDIPYQKILLDSCNDKSTQKPSDEFVITCPEDSIAFTVSEEKWRTYLNKCVTLDSSFIENIPAGKYSMMIMFGVSETGTVLNPKILNDPGYGFGEKGLAIFKSYKGVWHLPSENQEGKIVYRQPIIFEIEDE